MEEVRKVKAEELKQLLALYRHLHPSDEVAPQQEVTSSWQLITGSEFYHYFAIEKDQQLVSTCNLNILPNLTRGARPIALIENVVTHPDYRKQGLGKKVMQHAIEFAKKQHCYKIMLLSNSERKEAHSFYQSLGFRADSKTGFVFKC